ncbi:hypothetical protein RVR_8309 [Actinacidiphila reveromycinica]|uniref:Uncharacterized protein n=1 Tax=Actinacidiphila reveromycinica TaxID=659352 RepID=A0A7U3URY6_9ACTN|nr:hypothetical protein [Streptomyces sp. SN-593]BBA99270.1 hypothetical protein RVR_5815 [Streptomyces sp. SN-593]BBB01067.1 hypothetical protein RVR_8309 [Streptomyces sp. SN-593]
MAAWSEQIPLDQITAEARRIRFWRTVLTVLGGLLFGVGWLAAKGCGLVWLGVAWVAAALRIGWQEARRGAARTD